jgi:small nuclear ribonucleoprotein D1
MIADVDLVRFLMKLSGETVVVEMKDGREARGKVVGVDKAMTMHMTNVKLTSAQGQSTSQDAFTIRGPAIRYVQLPDTLNLDLLLIDDRGRKTVRRKRLQPDSQAASSSSSSSEKRGRGRGGRGRGRARR